LLYDFLKPESFRKDKEKLVDLLGAIATLILLPFYLPLALFLSIFEPVFFKRGSIVEVYASKEKP
jgi:hypothetical protein